MYSIIIVDDDKFIQKGLAEGSYWKELGFEVLGTFDDGQQALEFLRSVQVDVVLTDIKMTYIGGIELARYVYEAQMTCKVVFISAYKEFELARQAIQYGVKDYILKPTVEEKIIGVFKKIRKELDEKAKDVELRSQIDTYWRELRPILIEKFVNSLIMGALKDKNAVFQRMKFLYPDIDAECCASALVDMEIKHYEQFAQKSKNYGMEQISDAIYSFINFYQGAGYFHVVFKYKGTLRLFIIMKECCGSLEETYGLFGQQLEHFCEAFQEIFVLHATLKIEKFFKNVYEVMDYQADKLHMSAEQKNDEIFLQQNKLEIMDNIREGNISLAQNIMHSSLSKVLAMDMRYGKSFVKDVFSGMADFLREKNPAELVKMGKYLDYNNISKLSSAHEIILYCNRIFDRLKSLEDIHVMTDEHNLMNRIVNYVDLHIYDDICLEDIANKFYVSVRHMRRIFKNQTGETFLQYVTARKMEKARELLQNSEYKVYQVGEKLGYRKPRYFAKLFFNHYGYYPSQVRQEAGESERDYDEK